MNPQADRLIAAIETGIGASAAVHRAPSGLVTAPCVVVAPAAEWETPDGHGQVRQNWDIHVYVQAGQPDRGWDQLWDLTQRVAVATRSVGSVWDGTDYADRDSDADHRAATVRIHHRYPTPQP